MVNSSFMIGMYVELSMEHILLFYGQNGDKWKRWQVKGRHQNGDRNGNIQNGDKPNNTYSFSEAYVIDCRLYMACKC